MAISEALVVLGYMERPEDEQPPPEIWHHEERLKEWWASVEQNREDRLRGYDPVPQADEKMESNELAKGYR